MALRPSDVSPLALVSPTLLPLPPRAGDPLPREDASRTRARARAAEKERAERAHGAVSPEEAERLATWDRVMP